MAPADETTGPLQDEAVGGLAEIGQDFGGAHVCAAAAWWPPVQGRITPHFRRRPGHDRGLPAQARRAIVGLRYLHTLDRTQNSSYPIVCSGGLKGRDRRRPTLVQEGLGIERRGDDGEPNLLLYLRLIRGPGVGCANLESPQKPGEVSAPGKKTVSHSG